jgi:hypothetical protein
MTAANFRQRSLAVAEGLRRGAELACRCDFSMAHVPPERWKRCRAVVVSPRSYNAGYANGQSRCILVPFSALPRRR